MVRLLAALLASLVVAAGAAPAVAAPEWSPQPITWRPCGDEFPDIGSPEGDCGTLTVPLDWDRPSGQTVDLRVARHRATDPARRIGVVLVNPGGPGSSNAEFALAAEPTWSPWRDFTLSLVGEAQLLAGRVTEAAASFAQASEREAPAPCRGAR